MHLVQIYLSCHVNVFLLYFCLHLLAHSITEQTGVGGGGGGTDARGLRHTPPGNFFGN